MYQQLYVRDVMSSPVITVALYTPLPLIKRLMCEKQVHRLPVVEHGRLQGMVTWGDVRNAFPSDVIPPMQGTFHHPLDRVRAKDIMRTDVVTIAPTAGLEEAARLFLVHRISGVPVLDHGCLAGIITKSDLCRAFIDGDYVSAAPELANAQRIQPTDMLSALPYSSLHRTQLAGLTL